MTVRFGQRILAIVIGAALILLPGVAQADIYWTNPATGTLGRANLDGTGVNQAFITGGTTPIGVAVSNTHPSWANLGTGRVGRANLDGTGVDQAFITGATSTYGVAVDGSHIYWSNFPAGTIGRANLDGTGVTQTFITGANVPTGIAVDDSHIYWSNFGAAKIGRANLDGTSVDQSFITGATLPVMLAVDDSHVFWANYTTGKVGRANLDGTGVNQAFITGAGALGPTGVAVDPTHVYWAGSANKIGRSNLDGSGVNQAFITGTTAPLGVAVISPQTITFPTLVDTQIDLGPVNLAATASSGLPVTYASDTPTVCTVTAAKANLLKVGTCSITASQAGNTRFTAATPVQRSFQVTPIPPAPVVKKQTTTKVKSKAGGSKLFVRVKPNLTGGKHWKFKVQKVKTNGNWKTLSTVYQTKGSSKQTRKLNFAKGTYRVKVKPRYGFVGFTSQAVQLIK